MITKAHTIFMLDSKELWTRFTMAMIWGIIVTAKMPRMNISSIPPSPRIANIAI
jgi:hypothetical protein